MSDHDWTKSTHYSIDPLPDVASSMLNSADIVRYANKGCLVHPFSKDGNSLNPATYTIPFLGTLYLWEQDGDSRAPDEIPITERKRVRLPKNSITYLETGVEFRLPQYIAVRFNLHIRHVHRGILLGTGPIVDPGFVGPLLIPLHNLTANDYDIIGGDPFLWVEFTKLTRHEYWTRPPSSIADPPPKDLVVFRSRKQGLKAHQYLDKAGVGTTGVVSAFKGELYSLRKSTLAAEESAKDASTYTRNLTLAGGVGVIVAVAALVFAAYELFQNNAEMATGIHDRLDRIERQIGLLPPKKEAASADAVIEPTPGEPNAITGAPASPRHDDSEGVLGSPPAVEDGDLQEESPSER